MPTAQPRHTIIETDEISRALEGAAQRWPDDRERPEKLLLDLIREGHRAITPGFEWASEDRRTAIIDTSGALTGSYPDGYLEQLRDDWPE